MYAFVDESGDPNFLGHRGKNLLALGQASRHFLVGALEISDPGSLTKDFERIRKEIAADTFINVVPSVSSSLRQFHANKDCREVQERVFRALAATEFRFQAVVLEKRLEQFQQFFHSSRSEVYAYLVERLFENRLHKHESIDVYFSKMQKVTHEASMWTALENAQGRFRAKWGHKGDTDLRIFLQQPSEHAGLQAVDYCLWALHRVYHHQDFRYYRFLQEKISLVMDLNYGKELLGTYFTRKKPITKDRFAGT